MPLPDNYVQQIEQERKEKDQFFETHPQSPIPQADRESFDGLAYFPPDPSYRFELELDEHDNPETISVETTHDGVREYLRWGEFQFEIDDEAATLQAYRSDPSEDRLWVPFRDETNGAETYPAGRYLDLEEAEHRDGDGWILDFNLAYNPSCAYADAYECPLIPMENWLDIRIEAGEKTYEK